MTTMTTVPGYNPDEFDKLIKQVAPGLAQAGKQSNEALKMPAGVWDEAKFAEITAHLRQPAEAAANKQLESVTASMRAKGFYDSGRHGTALLEKAGETQRQIADNIDVPLILEQMRQRDTAERATIQQAADIGSRQVSAYQSQQGLNLQGQNQEFTQRLAMRQQELDEEVQKGTLTVAQARQKLDEEIQRGQLGIQTKEQGEASRIRNLTLELDRQVQLGQLSVAERNQKLDEEIQRGQLGLSTKEQEEASRIRDLSLQLDKQVQLGQLTVAEKNQKLDEEIKRGQLEIDTARMWMDRDRLTSDLTGKYLGKDTLAARQVAVQEAQLEVETLNAALKRALDQGQATGTFVDPVTGEQQQTLQAKLQDAQIRLEEAQVTGDYRTVQGEVLKTLAAKQQEIDKRLAEAGLMGEYTDANGNVIGKTLTAQQLDLQRTNDEVTRAIQRAQATGTFVDPETGLSADTLQKWQIQIAEAATTGIYKGEKTLESKLAEYDQGFRDKATFGYDREDGTHIYGTNELALVQQQNEQAFDKMLLGGFTYVDPDTGEERYVMGRDEQVTDARKWEEMTRVGYDSPVYGADGRTPLKDSRGNVIMSRVEGTQELSTRLQERELDLREKGLDADAAHQQALLEWEQQRTEGYSKVRTFTFDDLGMGEAPADAFNDQAGNFSLERFYVWADDTTNSEIYSRLRSFLGGEPTGEDLQRLMAGESVAMRDPKGQPRVDYIEGSVGLEQARMMLQETLQENGFTQESAERQAREAYDEKVRNGYNIVEPGGHVVRVKGTQTYQEEMLRLQSTLGISEEQARWKLAEQSRNGYLQVTEYPPGSKNYRTVKVQGTQEYEAGREDLRMQLQKELQKAGFTQESAERKAAQTYAEDVRTGYWEDVIAPGGYKTRVYVGGTQDFAKTIQDQADTLVKAGWSQDAAMQRARIAADTAAQFGGFRETIDRYGNVGITWVEGTMPAEERMELSRQTFQKTLQTAGFTQESAERIARETYAEEVRAGYWKDVRNPQTGHMERVYVGGTQDFAKSMSEIAQDFEREGWSHDEAVRKTEYVMSQATNDLSYLQQTYMDQRKYYYERQGMTSQQASDAATRDWNGVKGNFGPQLQVQLAQMNIDAAEKNFDTQANLDRMNAIIGAGSQLAGNALSWMFTPDATTGASAFVQLAGMTGRGYAVTPQQLMQMAVAGGGTLSLEQATALSTSMNAAQPTGIAATPIGKFGKWAGAGVTSFGSYITGSVGIATMGATAFAVGAAAIAGVAYGAYKVYDWWRDNQKEDAANRKDFNAYIDQLPESDYDYIREEIVNGYPGLNWSDRGDVFAHLETAMGKDDPVAWFNERIAAEEKQQGSALTVKELKAARDLYNFEPTGSMGAISTDLRGLLDRDFFNRADVTDITLADRDSLINIWRNIPKAAKSESLPKYISGNPSNAHLRMIMQDVATFTAGMGIMDTQQLSNATMSLWQTGALRKPQGQLTVAELNAIDQIVVQSGMSAKLPVTEKQAAVERLVQRQTNPGGHTEGSAPPTPASRPVAPPEVTTPEYGQPAYGGPVLEERPPTPVAGTSPTSSITQTNYILQNWNDTTVNAAAQAILSGQLSTEQIARSNPGISSKWVDHIANRAAQIRGGTAPPPASAVTSGSQAAGGAAATSAEATAILTSPSGQRWDALRAQVMNRTLNQQQIANLYNTGKINNTVASALMNLLP